MALVLVYESNCLHEGPRVISGMPSVEGLSKGSKPAFTRASEKITENSVWLGRQVRPGIESGTTRLAVLSARTAPPLVELMGYA